MTNINIFHTNNIFTAQLEDGTPIAQWATMDQMGEWVSNRGGMLGAFARTSDGQRYRKAMVENAQTTFVCGLKPIQ